jgi:hypothetical protein
MQCANFAALAGIPQGEAAARITAAMPRPPNPRNEVEAAVAKAYAESVTRDATATDGLLDWDSPIGRDSPQKVASPSGAQVSFYASKTDRTGAPMPLAEILEGIKGGDWAAQVEPVREAVEAGNDAAKEEAKGRLPAFTPSGAFSVRRKDGLSSHSGMIVADIDGLPTEAEAVKVRDTLARDVHVHAAFISPSGRGVKALVRVDPCADAGEHEAAFAALGAHFSSRHGIALDTSGKDVSRLCFVSHDPGAFIRKRKALPFMWRTPEVKTAGGLEIEEVADFIEQDPPMLDPIIEGVFEPGDKIELVAPSKQRKSFFLLDLLFHVAIGRDWLGFKIPKRWRVLYVNLELKHDWIHRRIHRNAKAYGINADEVRGWLRVINARGKGQLVREQLADIARREKLDMVAVDPRYKLHKPGESENLSEGLAGIFQMLDDVAETGAAVLVVHHDGKGDQSEKSVADRGSGSGSAARDVDAKFVLSPQAHEPDIASVIETMCRNYPPLEPFCARWVDHKFTPAPDLPPIKLGPDERKKIAKAKYAMTDEAAFDVLGDNTETATKLRALLRKKGASKDEANDHITCLLTSGCWEEWQAPIKNGAKFIGPPSAVKRRKAEVTDQIQRKR